MALGRFGSAVSARLLTTGSRHSSGGAAVLGQNCFGELPRRRTPASLMWLLRMQEAQRLWTSAALKPRQEMSRSICGGARVVAGLPSPAVTNRRRLLVARQVNFLKLAATPKRLFSTIPSRLCEVRAELGEEGRLFGQEMYPGAAPPTSPPISTPTPGPIPSSNPGFNPGASPNPSFNSGPNPGFNNNGPNFGPNPMSNTSPNPGGNLSSNPSFNPGYNPNINSGFNASSNPGPGTSFNPGPNGNFNPGASPSFNPGAGPGANPGASTSFSSGAGPSFNPSSGPSPASAADGSNDPEASWRSYFANPAGWWDDRAKKRTPAQPDFVRKGSREPLFIDSPTTPSWVAAELAKMPPPPVTPPRTQNYNRPVQTGYRQPWGPNSADPSARPVTGPGYGSAYVPPRRNPDGSPMDSQPSAAAGAPPIDVTPTSVSTPVEAEVVENGGPVKPKKPLDPATQAHLDELRAPVDMERLKATMGKPISEWANYGKPESERVNIPPPKPKEEVKARPKKPMSPETKAHLEALRAPVDMERLKATIGKPIEAWINYGKPESEWVHPPPPKPRVEKPKKPMSPETKAHLEALRAPVDMERLKATIGKPIEAWINYGKPESEWVHPPPPKPKVERPKKPMSPETKAHLEALRGPVDMERLRATIGKPIEAWINYGKPESEWWHPPPPKDKDSMPPPRRRSVRSRSSRSSS